MDEEHDLSPDQAGALRRVGERWGPPEHLAERTVAALRARGLVASASRNRSRILGLPAAAALVTFVMGFALGTALDTSLPTNKETTMPASPQYALLLFEDGSYRPAPSEDAQKDRVREYGAWLRSKGESGRFVAGEKLDKEGRWCRMREGRLEVLDPVSDGSLGTLAGYFIIGASSYDDALDIARDCPHLRYGGTIEVRRLES